MFKYMSTSRDSVLSMRSASSRTRSPPGGLQIPPPTLAPSRVERARARLRPCRESRLPCLRAGPHQRGPAAGHEKTSQKLFEKRGAQSERLGPNQLGRQDALISEPTIGRRLNSEYGRPTRRAHSMKKRAPALEREAPERATRRSQIVPSKSSAPSSSDRGHNKRDRDGRSTARRTSRRSTNIRRTRRPARKRRSVAEPPSRRSRPRAGPHVQGSASPQGRRRPTLRAPSSMFRTRSLAGWKRERMPEAPNAPAISIAPDWACEILSPSTAFKDLARASSRFVP